jgi:hypothetical protein
VRCERTVRGAYGERGELGGADDGGTEIGGEVGGTDALVGGLYEVGGTYDVGGTTGAFLGTLDFGRDGYGELPPFPDEYGRVIWGRTANEVGGAPVKSGALITSGALACAGRSGSCGNALLRKLSTAVAELSPSFDSR